MGNLYACFMRYGVLGFGILLGGLFLRCKAGTDLVLPWVANNADFKSKIVIDNLNNVPVVLCLRATRADGVAAETEVVAEGLGQVVLDAGQAFPAFGPGGGFAVRLQSEAQNIKAGLVVRGTASASGDSPGQTIAQDAESAASILLFSYTPTAADIYSGPVVVNLSEVSAQVTFYAFQGGQRFQSEPVTVPPGGTPYAALVQSLFPQLTGDLFLVAVGDQPLLGSAFIFNAQREPSMTLAEPLSSVPQPLVQADLVFVNGVVYGSDTADSVATASGKIVFIGNQADVAALLGEGTQVIDLEGKMLLPGFIDNHNHLGEGGEVSCFPEGEEALEHQIRLLANCAAGLAPGAWVIGYGGALEIELGVDEVLGRPLEVMDEAFPQNPAIIMDYSSHAMFVNSHALARAGITKATPDPQGGIIMKDEQGELNGVLVDNAGDLVMELAVNELPNRFDLLVDGILFGLDAVRRAGITTVGDGRTYWQRGLHEAWLQVRNQGNLTARVSLRPWIYPELGRSEQLEFLCGAWQNDLSQLLIVNQVKMYTDGVPEYGTGRVIEPYVDTYFPEYPNGINYIASSDMASWLADLSALGYGAHIHAIGDLAIREALDAIESVRNLGSSKKYHMTHLSMMDPADLSRFALLDVDADFQLAQPSLSLEDRIAGFVPLIGRERALQVLINPIFEVQASGANVVLSSDWSVNALSPLSAIGNAVIEGSLSLDDAIKAYTCNPARALGLGHVTGDISLGKSADFVVLDRDLRHISPQDILTVKVVMTVLQGRLIFRAEP